MTPSIVSILFFIFMNQTLNTRPDLSFEGREVVEDYMKQFRL
jgi:hypothetical protein